jgi:hypothetical protein
MRFQDFLRKHKRELLLLRSCPALRKELDPNFSRNETCFRRKANRIDDVRRNLISASVSEFHPKNLLARKIGQWVLLQSRTRVSESEIAT